MPIINNTILCISKLVKGVDLMSSVLNTYTHNTKQRKLWEVLDMSIALIISQVFA